jgi:Ni2+-binding GTPase involved in maturation of urease and hydrogenase
MCGSYASNKVRGKHQKVNTLDEDQQTAFDMAKDGHNLVVIVQGGCGKTFLIKQIVNDLRSKGKTVTIACSTGLFLWIKFHLNLWGQHLLNHGTLKQCKPRSPTSSFATGSSCKKITG